MARIRRRVCTYGEQQQRRRSAAAPAPEGGGQHLLQAVVPQELHVFEERDGSRADQEVPGSSKRECGSSREEGEGSGPPEEAGGGGGEESEGRMVRRLVRHFSPAANLHC